MKMETSEKRQEEAQESISAHYDVRLPKLPWHRRMQIPIIAAVVYSVIRVLGPTLRFEVLGRAAVDRIWATEAAHHLGILASLHYSDRVVRAEPRHRGDEHHGV